MSRSWRHGCVPTATNNDGVALAASQNIRAADYAYCSCRRLPLGWRCRSDLRELQLAPAPFNSFSYHLPGTTASGAALLTASNPGIAGLDANDGDGDCIDSHGQVGTTFWSAALGSERPHG